MFHHLHANGLLGLLVVGAIVVAIARGTTHREAQRGGRRSTDL